MFNFIKNTCLFTSLILVFTFSSCSDDGNSGNGDSDCDGNTLSFMLNGQLWTGTTFNNTMDLLIDPNVPDIPTRRMDIRAVNDAGEMFIITLTNPDQSDEDCMEIGDVYLSLDEATSSYDNVQFVSMLSSTGAIIFSSTEGDLEITSCDPSEKRIEGTFSFVDFFEENTGTNGSFSICFMNIQ